MDRTKHWSGILCQEIRKGFLIADDDLNEVHQHSSITIFKPLCKLSKVFLDISIPSENKKVGRLVIELRSDIVPICCNNFKALCKCANPDRCYKGTRFHRIIPGCFCQGGDIEFNNGGGVSKSSFNGNFKDESFLLRHSRPGIVSTALSLTTNGNASQFMISAGPLPWLDGKCVPFGEVVDGFHTLGILMKYGSQSGSTHADIIIQNCGELI